MINAADFEGVFDDAGGIGDIATIGGGQVPGHFQSEYVIVDNVENCMPVFRCFASHVSDVSNGDAVEVHGESYRIKSIQPGAVGVFTRLILDEA